MSFNELCRKPVRFSKPFVDLYGSFVDLYNPFGDLSLLSTLYSPHGPQDHLSD